MRTETARPSVLAEAARRAMKQRDASSSSRSSPPTAQEQQDVETLIALLGGTHSPDHALRLLREHHGDMDKAASALLESEPESTMPALSLPDTGRTTPGPRTPPPSASFLPTTENEIIDLTQNEDIDFNRALQASLEEQTTTFRPSDRPPNANWAMVPSNVQAGIPGMSQDDHSLSRAIEASLTHDPTKESFEELPIDERVRKDGRPVALRPTQSTLAYAAVIVHGLFFVPQVRHSIAYWRPEPDTGSESEERAVSPPVNGHDHIVWSLLELFANMDLALLSELNVDDAMQAFGPKHWSSLTEQPGDLSFHLYNNLALSVEHALHEKEVSAETRTWNRLFHFRYGFNDGDDSQEQSDRRRDLSVVKVEVRGTEHANDLVSCLSSELSLTGNVPTPKKQVIFEASDVVAFQLVRENALPSYTSATSAASASSGKNERQTFKYPRSMYLDQFLKENFVMANARRTKQRELGVEVEKLVEKKKTLVRFKDRDILADLRSSLHYYDNVAEPDNDPERETQLQNVASKLRQVVKRLENELQTIDATIEGLKLEAANIFDHPSLQKHRYDLRVVLVHDGLLGRQHLYSYVKQHNTWWKTVDHAVTEVSEDAVLNDSAGLHLGAGPYFLIYSRAISKEEETMRSPWPEDVKNAVKHNNVMFLEQLPAHVATEVTDPNSPPSSPPISVTPSEYTISSGTVEPPLSRGDTMDVTDHSA